MYERYPEQSIERDDASKSALAIATFVLAAIIFAAFALAPRDSGKLVKGVSCSVITEREISSILGTQMRMLAPSGNVCRYVSTGEESSTLTVIARQNPRPPAEWGEMQTDSLHLVGHDGALYVRSGDKSYILMLSQPGQSSQAVTDGELRLAAFVRYPGVIARNGL